MKEINPVTNAMSNDVREETMETLESIVSKITEATQGKMAVAVVLWEPRNPDKTSYASNALRDESKRALSRTVSRL